MRLLFLNADPPLGLLDSGPYHDEGQYTHNARNMALFGVWQTDDYNNMYISPVLNLLTFVSFRLFGVGHWQARLVTALFSLGALLCLFDGLRRMEGLSIASLAVALLGLDYFFLIYSRVALMDVPTVFWMTLAFCGWQRAVSGSRVGAVIAGAAAAMAWVFKTLALPFIAVPFLSLLVLIVVKRNRRTTGYYLRIGGWILIGVGAVLAVWYAAFYWPNQADVSYYMTVFSQERMPSGWRDLLVAAWRNFRWLEPTRLTPFLFVFGATGVLALLAERPWSLIASGWSFLGMWLIVFATMLYVSPYSPGRYWTTVMPPLAAFGAYGLWAITHPSGRLLYESEAAWSKFCFALLLMLPAIVLFVLAQNFVLFAPALNRRAVRYPLYALALANVLAALPVMPWFLRFRAWLAAWMARRGSTVLIAAIAAVLTWNLGHYLAMVQQRQYTLVESARWLDDFLPDGAVVLGSGATTVTIETDLVAIPTWLPNNDWVNGDRPWDKYQADYWIEAMRDYNGIAYTPPVAAELISVFEAQGRPMGVWRLPDGAR